jgi:hypothetical protein
LATFGEPPLTVTAPPLTRILPAASRLTVIVLSRLSPNTDSVPALNVAVVAAFAGTVVAAITPTDSAAAVSTRRAARREPRLRLGFSMWLPIWEAGWEDLGE